MSVTKAEALRLIETLPEDCTYEDIHYHLYVQQKVERGLAAVSTGQFVPQDEAEREVEGWLTSSGLTPR
jgi:predicted transcriptional regulator